MSEPAFLFLGSECPRLVTQPRSRKIRVIHLHRVDDEVRGGGGEVNALAVGESAQSREEQSRKWFESTVWSDGARFLVAKGIASRQFRTNVGPSSTGKRKDCNQIRRCQVSITRSWDRDIPRPTGTPTSTRHSWEFKAPRSSSTSTTTLLVRDSDEVWWGRARREPGICLWKEMRNSP